jgi:hypothetical protein
MQYHISSSTTKSISNLAIPQIGMAAPGGSVTEVNGRRAGARSLNRPYRFSVT